MVRDSFIFYESFHVALSKLDDAAYKKIMTAICEYALYGTDPELDGMLTLAFDLIRPQIDANNKRYEDGKKGGRPAKNSKTSGYKPKNQWLSDEKPVVSEVKTSGFDDKNQWLPESEPNVNVNVNVNDNENVNDNVSVNGEVSNTPKQTHTNTHIPNYSEISEYCRSKGYQTDIDRFIQYNAGKGWSMEWKTAMDMWVTKDKDKKKEDRSKNRFNNFENSQHYDFAAIEAASRKKLMEG